MDIRTSDEDDQIQRSSSSTSGKSSTHSDIQSKQAHKTEDQSPKIGADTYPSFRKEPSIKRKSYNHDVLVIQTQPPKVNNRQEKISIHLCVIIMFLFCSLNHYLIYSLQCKLKPMVRQLIQHLELSQQDVDV
jgi:hypothetical protein